MLSSQAAQLALRQCQQLHVVAARNAPPTFGARFVVGNLGQKCFPKLENQDKLDQFEAFALDKRKNVAHVFRIGTFATSRRSISMSCRQELM